MRQRDNLQFIAGLVTFLLLVFICAALIKGTFFSSAATSKDDSYLRKQREAGCGDTALRTCTVTADVAGTCTEETARRAIEVRLKNPLELSECKQAEELLVQACPAGCVIDYGSLITVPGKIAFEFYPEPDESGRCQAKGKRSMQMRALCVTKAG